MKYTNIRFVPGNIGSLTTDEAEIPDRYFATDADTGEEVELLSTKDYYAGQGPEGTSFIAKPLGNWYQGQKGVYNDSGIFKPFEAVDAQGNVIGTWNMAKNDPNWVNRYVAPVIRTVATVLAGQAIMPSVSEALGLDSLLAPEVPADVPVGGASYAPGSFQEYLSTEGLKVAGATPVPGSLQAYLPSLGVTPLVQGGVGAGTADLFKVNYDIGDALKNAGRVANALNQQPTVQQQTGLAQGSESRPRGVDYSGLLGLLQNKAGLLPNAEQYRRGLL